MANVRIRKIGRDAGTGQFRSISYAKRHPKTAIVETIKMPRKRRKKK
jgi:hypothetical protein